MGGAPFVSDATQVAEEWTITEMAVSTNMDTSNGIPDRISTSFVHPHVGVGGAGDLTHLPTTTTDGQKKTGTAATMATAMIATPRGADMEDTGEREVVVGVANEVTMTTT